MKRELCSRALTRAFLAELIGTTVFVFVGLGSALPWPLASPSVLQVALAFGLAIGTLAQCLGHVSGAHLNPAVTAAFLLGSRISLCKAASYVLAQLLGAVVGAALLYELTPREVHGSLGVNGPQNTTSAGQAVTIEMFLTLQLVLCVFASTDSRRTDVGFPALSIGLSVTAGHLIGIYYTGCSMNPARSFGPALVMGNFANHWIFWIGPLAGAIVAMMLYDYLLCPRPRSTADRIAILRGDRDPEKEAEHGRQKKQSLKTYSVHTLPKLIDTDDKACGLVS
ncbi:aquaporin-5-like [Podarcis raffonei]|uniref:aquaporin-5-like n=1 Tax=Podarcis raffonei TaxID=65483 RepID=UPI0023292633|nr:aquaporin-5-like [Podarcis raffonei]